MTAAVGMEPGAEIGAGGRASPGAPLGLNSVAGSVGSKTLAANGQDALGSRGLSASVESAPSFRASWQAMLHSANTGAASNASPQQTATVPSKSSAARAGATRSSAKSAPAGNTKASAPATVAGQTLSQTGTEPKRSGAASQAHAEGDAQTNGSARPDTQSSAARKALPAVQVSGTPASESGEKSESSSGKNHGEPRMADDPSQLPASPTPMSENLLALAIPIEIPPVAANSAAHIDRNFSQPSPGAAAGPQSSAGGARTSSGLSRTPGAAASSQASSPQAGRTWPEAGTAAATTPDTEQKREAGLVETAGTEAAAITAPAAAALAGAAPPAQAAQQQTSAAPNLRTPAGVHSLAAPDQNPAEINSANNESDRGSAVYAPLAAPAANANQLDFISEAPSSAKQAAPAMARAMSPNAASGKHEAVPVTAGGSGATTSSARNQSIAVPQAQAGPAQERQASAAPNVRSSGDRAELANPEQARAETNSAPRESSSSAPVHPAAVAGAQRLSGAASVAATPDSPQPEPAAGRGASHLEASEVSPPQIDAAGSQPSGQGIAAAAFLRGAENAQAFASPASAHLSSTTAASPSNGPQETFAALDSDSAMSTPTWIHAGARRAEAGFQDPALGWVGVQANLNGGNVHAALMPESAEAANVLSGHLAGLSAFLAEQHALVATLTLAPSTGQGVEDGAQQQGSSQNAGQRAPQEPSSSLSSSGLTTAAVTVQGVSGEGREFNAVLWPSEGRGTRISVMA